MREVMILYLLIQKYEEEEEEEEEEDAQIHVQVGKYVT